MNIEFGHLIDILLLIIISYSKFYPLYIPCYPITYTSLKYQSKIIIGL